MKIERLVSGGAAVAFALGLAASAKAGIVTATYKGVVTDGYDQTGVFGTPGANLTGDSFTAVYTINDAEGSSNYDPPYSSEIEGGSVIGVGSPVSATITINGLTALIAGKGIGEAEQGTLAGDYALVADYADNCTDLTCFNYSYYMSTYIKSYSNPIVTNFDYHTPLSYTVQPGDYAYGTFVDEAVADIIVNNSRYSTYTYADFAPTSVIIAGVPEPATWTMLILGAAMIGFAVRRRREGLAFAAGPA